MLLRHEIIHPRQKSPQSTERWHNQEPDDHQPISRLPQHSITDNAHRVKMPNKQTSHLGKTIPVSAPPTTRHKANVAFSKALCVAARIQNYCLPLEQQNYSTNNANQPKTPHSLYAVGVQDNPSRSVHARPSGTLQCFFQPCNSTRRC